MARPVPIVEYAHKIGKNTAEFTTKDLVAFMKWWMKEKPRKDLLNVTPKEREEFMADPNKRMTPKQRAQYNKDVEAMNKFRAAQTSRLNSDQVIDIEQADDRIAQEMQEEATNEVVVEMGLTALDIKALKWGLDVLLSDYDLEGTEFNVPLTGLKEAINEVWNENYLHSDT